jgi:dynein heavy chain, axonemal
MNSAIKVLERCVEQGKPVLIENLDNSIDASIAPIYARQIIKRGRTSIIKMGDKELTLDPKFNLFMHTKLSNPHYPPEIQAECTLINFTVTEAGLEDQLLTLVVKKERPDLASKKEEIVSQQNEFKITLKKLEDGLLQQLADATGDILENIELIESLEHSKALSTEINQKVEIAKVTEIAINEASEAYRPAASRGALVFFMMNELTRIHSYYKFSLDSFIIVINRAIDLVAEKLNPKKEPKEEPAEGEEAEAAPEEEEEAGEEEDAEMTPRTLKNRVNELIESITYQGFNYIRRGTFERHKLIIATMLCFKINIRKGLIVQKEVDALVKKEISLDAGNQPESLKFIMESAWPAVKGLEQVKMFESLVSSMESEALQWRKWYMDEKAESVELPRAFKDCSLFHRLLLLRAMRPDRLTGALIQYVTEWLGLEYVEQPSFDVFELYAETKPGTPTFFVLFPGVDPTPDVEKIGFANNKTAENGTFTNISMGQGQEENANLVLSKAAKEGHWCMFQNVHLMISWMKKFERQFEIAVEGGAHPEFRCFISAEPPPLPSMEIVPESIM